ncbi:protein disks lost [Calliphora vicina]|uniref:protein disks lost n=1 Tax=Calliphora vicina TaxID=7373 RepID=UPI00325B4D23
MKPNQTNPNLPRTMTKPAEEKLKSIIKYKLDSKNLEFRQWFLKQFEVDATNLCTIEEFAVYFLNSLRQYTEVHLKTSGTETPKCQTPVRAIKANICKEESATPRRLLLDLSQPDTSTPNENLSLKTDHLKHNSYSEFESHSTPRLSTSVDRLGYSQNNSTSTPVRRNVSKNTRRLTTTPGSANKSATSSLCLGDFLVMNTSTSSRSQKKKTTPTANQQTAQKATTEKPKKRLQPISLGKKAEPSNNSSIFAGESSFSNENNILKITNSELVDKDQCAILAARKSLVLNASEITKELKNVSIPLMPTNADTMATSNTTKETLTEEMTLDLKKMGKNLSIKRLAEIYALIIDLNLCTNILNELTFLLNLLNATNANNPITEVCTNMEQLQLHDINTNEEDEGLACLEHLPNAVYFALLCLAHEKRALGSLDAKSLGVVLISERFSYLDDDVKSYLLEVYQRKQQLVAEKPFCDTSLCFDVKPCNNVYFQQEQDSRENFTSHQEFANFRAQRDLFYKCLKHWESHHLNPMWKFSSEVTPKIKEIFQFSENCINMAHLAKLFVSQLLLSASNASSPEEIGLDVDLQKFSKLTQRLIAPSQFSVDYQFPRTEAFFRDFILEARSLAFVEQLKIELYTELTTQNDSSLDQIDISKADNDADEQNVSLIDCTASDNVVVRPDILNSMLILAKFLGYTISLPYNLSSCNTMPAQVEKNQVRLRSLMQPTFDLCVILEQAIEQGKLLIAIPWLVQYFGMLDNVTLQLENYMKTLKLMYALYTYLGLENPKPFNSTSLFIIKLCLGWLFESKQFIAEQYYNYRATLKCLNSQESTNELEFIKCKLRYNIESENLTLNSYLESLLPIACPFLAEFRVSIMPAKYAQTKNASRTGRYRHITTRIAELPRTADVKEDGNTLNTDQNKSTQVQTSLIQAFLHSQNASTRQIIKFCTERCYKSVVKDGQIKILLPSKTNADNLVNELISCNYHFVYNSIKTIYNDAYVQVEKEWNESIPKMLNKRINNALESLLPEETASVLKRTYFMIIEREAKHKISQWFCANIVRENFFCGNLQEMANKICSANKNKVQLGSTQLTIIKDTPSVSDLIDELQYWLHCTSIRVERFNDSKPLVKLLTNLIKAFENELPSFLYHLLGAGIIQLLQHIIAKHFTQLSDQLIEAACQVWLHPNMQKALDSFSSSDICIYDALVTVAFIESLGTKTNCFNQLGHLVVIMIRKHVITVNYANNLFVSIFKHEWQPFVLSEISNMLKTIAKETSGVSKNTNENDREDEDDNEKSNLFMEMLADLSRDVDFF